MKRTLLYLLAILIIGALVAAGLKLRLQRQQELAALPPPEAAPWAVTTSPVTRGRATSGFPALALVKGANEAAVSPRISGIILEMPLREGEQVKKGTLLARIDTREMAQKLASLEAQLAGARADAERQERDTVRLSRLLKKRSISESQVDETRSAARSAREQVHSLERQIAAERTRLGYATIEAPFDGVISARLSDPGELATIGKPIYRIVSTTGGRLEVRLPADILEQVHPGTEVRVSHHGRQLELQADRVYPALDERSLGRMEINLERIPFGAAPGALLPARVITTAVDAALLVPADALVPGGTGAQAWVFTLEGGEKRLRRVPVRIRLRAREGVAGEGELEAGMPVVVAHETTLLRLRAGDRVTPSTREPVE